MVALCTYARATRICAAICTAVALSPAGGSAQEPPRVRLGGGISGDLLVGDASDFLDGGYGGVLLGQYRLDAADRWRLAVEVGTNTLDGGSVPTRITTGSNTVITALAAPRLVLRVGPFHPFIAPTFGLLAVRWRFETAGSPDRSGSGVGPAWGGQAGLAVSLGHVYPIEIGVEGRVIDAGEYDFARVPSPSGPGDDPGLLTTDFGVLSVRVIVTIGL